MKKVTNKRKFMVAIWIIVVIILALVIYGGAFLADLFQQTERLEKGTLEVSREETIFIARDEIVYGAPYTGTLEYLGDEGELKKKGTKILNMTEIEENAEVVEESESKYEDVTKHLGDNMQVMENFASQKKGVISYFVDGNEGIINQTSIYEFTEEEMKALHVDPVDLEREEAKKGEPIFKIVDNSSWAMAFWTETENEDVYIEGSRVSVDFGDDSVRATVEEVKREADKIKVVLTTNRYYYDFAKEREVDVNIIVSEREGILVDKRSVVTLIGMTSIFKGSKESIDYLKETEDEEEKTIDDLEETYEKIALDIAKIKNQLKNTIKKYGTDMVCALDTLGEVYYIPVKILEEEGEQVLLQEEIFYDEDGNPIETVLPYQEILTNPAEN